MDRKTGRLPKPSILFWTTTSGFVDEFLHFLYQWKQEWMLYDTLTWRIINGWWGHNYVTSNVMKVCCSLNETWWVLRNTVKLLWLTEIYCKCRNFLTHGNNCKIKPKIMHSRPRDGKQIQIYRPTQKRFKHSYRMAQKTRPLCLTACNFRSSDQIGSKFGTHQCYFIPNITL